LPQRPPLVTRNGHDFSQQFPFPALATASSLVAGGTIKGWKSRWIRYQKLCFIYAVNKVRLMHAPMDRKLNGRRTAIAIGIGFALLIAAVVASIVASIASANADRWASHSLQVRQATTNLFSLVQDAETGQRGFLLTGDESYLQPFETAQKQIPAAEAGLRTLTADDPAQQSRLTRIYATIALKLRELSRTVDFAKTGNTTEALAIVRSNEGRNLMRQIRSAVNEFDEHETDLINARNQRSTLLRSILLLVTVAGGLLAGVVAILVGVASRRQVHELSLTTRLLQAEIVERERTEAALRQAQKMEALGQLTGGVAHDFNNMLSIIVGNLDLVLRRLSGEDARARVFVENSLAGARRASELTKRLLAFSRLQPLQPAPTDVNKCVSEMSELLRRTLGEGIELETVLGGGVWRAIVDTPQLESALLNLVINARDAMEGAGRLTIETANAELDQAYADAHAEVTAGQYVMIAVTDIGPGMTEDVMNRAFDPFFTTKRPGEGTGLGLSQVHGFIKQSKGHVKLYSEIGKGTTVKLYLPRDKSKGVPKEVQPSMSADNARPKDHVVLVVEDDGGVRTFTVSALRELGYEAIDAETVAVARQKLAENPRVTILLTDVVLPSENGRELANSLTKDRPDLVVLYMTGYTRNSIVHNGTLDAGVRLLSKPFTVDDLNRELRAALMQRTISA
jgi:signal transduction histidine kinase/CheY-like chemotaxis protein